MGAGSPTVQALMAQEQGFHGSDSHMWAANMQGRQTTGQVRFPLEICWSCEDPSPFFFKFMYIPLECFSSDKLMFSPRNMFHRKISEQPSL